MSDSSIVMIVQFLMKLTHSLQLQDRNLSRDANSGLAEIRDDLLTSGSRNALSGIGNARETMQKVTIMIQMICIFNMVIVILLFELYRIWKALCL